MIKRKGIRRRVTLTVILLVVSSLTLLGLALSGLIFVTQKNQLMALQKEVVKGAVNEINWDIHEIEMLLGMSAIQNDLLRLDYSQRFNILSQILTHEDVKLHNVLDELVLLDSSGRELTRVSRTRVFAASELAERPKAEEVIIPVKTGNNYYGPMTFDERTFEPFMTLSLPVLNYASRAVDGVLLGKIRLSKIWENVSGISFGKSGTIFITDVEGKVVAHPDPSVIHSNTFYKTKIPKGVQSGLNSENVLFVRETFQLGSRAFIVYATLKFREVLNLSFQTLSATAVFLFIFILFSITVCFIAANRIVRPIEALADTARGISAGDLGLTARVEDSDEIGDLADTFNVMASRLSETINSLKKQMSELKEAEEVIKQQNEFLNNVLNSLTHPFYIIDAQNYTVRMANDAARFGRLSGESTCYALTHQRDTPCDDHEHPCVIRKIKETGKPVTLEHLHYDGNGNPLINEVHGYPIFDSRGNIAQVIEYNLDITVRKNAEEKIKASLKEKEILLRELHHRTKNNMQVISSLLSLQAEYTKDKKYIAMLSESRNRIASMALVHEKLYRSQDFSNIDFNDYIASLVNGLYEFYGLSTGRIALKIDIEHIALELDTAIPCGLIINELVSNSLKHAFPEGRSGEVRIIFRKTALSETEKRYSLTVSDNGVGLPEDLDIGTLETLGLQLVSTLVQHQLQGKLEFDRTEGTTCRISFREVKYEKRF